MQTSAERTETGPKLPLVLYDGDCGFCARSVSWVLKHDRKGVFSFAPLQGETATNLVGKPTGSPDTWSMLLVDEEGTFDRSTAAFRILKRVGWGGFLPRMLLAVPASLRDPFYRLIAKIRYRVWGKVDSCAIPTPELRGRFLP
jgi:predicted DCC family thiol-disulfide oxidoreductase YuxK